MSLSIIHCNCVANDYNCGVILNKKICSNEVLVLKYRIIEKIHYSMSESEFSCNSSQTTIQTQIPKSEDLILKPNSQLNKKDAMLYENILKEIRDMNVLSSYKLYYLRGVSRNKLLQIIELYNMVICNVNEII